MSKGDMNPVMYGIFKMVEYKVQIFHDVYTYLLGQLCKIPKSFDCQRYRCGICCAFEDRLVVHLCCKKSHRSTEAIFLYF